MKYIICFLFFFTAACQKSDCLEERTAEPRVDSVTVLKDADGWYIKITARHTADFHRMIRLTIFFPEEVWYMIKLPAGKTAVTRRLDSALGEPIRWEAHAWGSWPYPD